MTFISGPRQCGKTTLAKHFLKQRKHGRYFNWDEKKFRQLWAKDPSKLIPSPQDETTPLVILDEIHKAKLWKRNLKGIYDTLEHSCDIIVTGSTHLNAYSKGSDSLMGRYYHFLLHPFSLAELNHKVKVYTDDLFETLVTTKTEVNTTTIKHMQLLDKFGPFPEPLLAASVRTLNLWQRGRVEKIVRENLRDLTRIVELSQIELLVSLLPEKIGSLLSIQSLSEDLEVAYTTVKRWLKYLQALYYYYEVKPYARSLTRAIKKANKAYLWDWSEVEDEGARFENMMASHLLKYCDYLTDTSIGKFELKFLKSKDQQEIDFLLLKNNKPWLPIEAKLNNDALSANWKFFLNLLPCKQGIQVVKKSGVHKHITTEQGEVLIISADQFLNHLV